MPAVSTVPASMLKRPKLRPHYRAEVIAGEGTFILSASEQIVLRGRLYERIVPLLDGRPVEDICRQLEGQTTPAKVFYTIRKLWDKGILMDADEQPVVAGAAFWSARGIEPSELQSRLADTTVSLSAAGVAGEHGGRLKTDALRSLLTAMSVRVTDATENELSVNGDLTVVLADHYLRNDLQSINDAALQQNKPWMLVKPVGGEIWLGPLFQPGATGCWECLAHRIRCNLPVLSYLESLLDGEDCPAIDAATTPASLSMAWSLAAGAISGWIAEDGALEHLEGKIQSFDVATGTMQSHVLLKQPHCPVCGESYGGAASGSVETAADESSASGNGTGNDTPQEDVKPVVLRSRPKVYTEDGGHRSLSPADTLATYGHHVSPICGAVTMLQRSASDNDGVMHVYVSGANVARGANSLGGLRNDLRESSCGKGTNDLQAKASALCEGLERYSGLFRGDEPRISASMHTLGDAAIHPNDCMLFSERQYKQRESRNAHPSIYNTIPQPFDPDRRMEWTPVWSVTHETARYLPTSYCYFDYPHDCDAFFCVGCSNGNAAGNSMEESVLQGLFELVERDSVGLWWYNRVSLPGVDLDSFEEPYLQRLQVYLQEHRRELWALDLSSDLQIPVFAALSRRVEGPTEQILFGFGAHLDPRIALLRAVTELNQMLVPLLEQSDESLPPEFTDEETSRWLRHATLDEHRYLAPHDGPLRRRDNYPQVWTDDLKDDLHLCREWIEQRGLELLVLDQTRPEIGLPVVKVFVPGLRHFWARFAPGRLYDVPVQLGWLDQPTPEEQLNPHPMFL